MTPLASLLAQNPEWSLVLAAYAAAEQALPPTPPRSEPPPDTDTDASDETRWVPRLLDVAGIETERLPRIHGRLIAEGLLRFNLLGRSAGIGYRLTPAGRQALGLSGQVEQDDHSEESVGQHDAAAA